MARPSGKTVLILGCGEIARTAYAPPLARDPGVGRLVFVDEPITAAGELAGLYDGVAYETVEEALASERPDGAVLTTARNVRHRAAMALIEAGVHLLVARDGAKLADWTSLARAAAARGLRLDLASHQLVAARDALSWIRDTGVEKVEYMWFQEVDRELLEDMVLQLFIGVSDPGDGPLLEVFAPHALAFGGAVYDWPEGGVVRTTVRAPRSDLGEGALPLGYVVTIEVEYGSSQRLRAQLGLLTDLPHPEVLHAMLTFGDGGILELPFPTARTREVDPRPLLSTAAGDIERPLESLEVAGAAHVRLIGLWAESLSLAPGTPSPLPVDAVRGAHVHAAMDAAWASLRRGDPVAIEVPRL